MIVCVFFSVRSAADFAGRFRNAGRFAALMVFSVEFGSEVAGVEMSVFVKFPLAVGVNVFARCGNFGTYGYRGLTVVAEYVARVAFFTAGSVFLIDNMGILMVICVYVAVRNAADFADSFRSAGRFAAFMGSKVKFCSAAAGMEMSRSVKFPFAVSVNMIARRSYYLSLFNGFSAVFTDFVSGISGIFTGRSNIILQYNVFMIICVFFAVRCSADFTDRFRNAGRFAALMGFFGEFCLTVIADMEMIGFIVFPFAAFADMVPCCGDFSAFCYGLLTIETEDISLFAFFVTGRSLCVSFFCMFMISRVYFAVRLSAFFADRGRNTGGFAAGMFAGSNGDFTVFYCEINFICVFIEYFEVCRIVRYGYREFSALFRSIADLKLQCNDSAVCRKVFSCGVVRPNKIIGAGFRRVMKVCTEKSGVFYFNKGKCRGELNRKRHTDYTGIVFKSDSYFNLGACVCNDA